jgi:hypothetical protein
MALENETAGKVENAGKNEKIGNVGPGTPQSQASEVVHLGKLK